MLPARSSITSVKSRNFSSAVRGPNSLKNQTLFARNKSLSRNKTSLSSFRSSFIGYQRLYSSTATIPKPKMDTDMFCFQCEQTQNGTGCTTVGVCGKDPEVAALQDLLVFELKQLSAFAHRLRKLGGEVPHKANEFTLEALFSTLTNVNFDAARFHSFIQEATELKDQVKEQYQLQCAAKGVEAEAIQELDLSGMTPEQMAAEGRVVGIGSRLTEAQNDRDALALQELLIYGIKGAAAYAHHAYRLGMEDNSIYEYVHEALDFILTNPESSNPEAVLGMALKCGEVNFRVMEILDQGSVTKYGHPKPTQVLTSAKQGKALLVSGHDLGDLEKILIATEGKGVNVYTHGELLPGHGYPGLKERFPHLVGNYGGAWQLQKFEFSKFPGPIVMTTNCLIEPRRAYKDRLYTTSVTGWPGVKHIEDEDFSPVVEHALQLDGFKKDEPETHVTVGFARNTVLSLAPELVEAVKKGALKNVFVIGGCDGTEGERSYFRDLAANSPQDSVVLTMGCGKYRFNKLNLGEIKINDDISLPRVLDMGQCNDSFSGIKIAVALAQELNTDVNSLPLHFGVSWFEQKAVAVFLTLLHLGIRNIRLGPRLPAFVPESTLNMLVEKFKLSPIGDAQHDLNQMLSEP